MRIPHGLSRDDIVGLHREHLWPAYTSSETHAGRDPFVIVDADGAYVEDASGARYLDGCASWWTMVLGHKHPRLLRAMHAQIDALPHAAMALSTNVPAALLAKELVDVAPKGLSRVHFSDDGSTAVEVAVKIAAQFWRQNGAPKKSRFLALSGAFHGDTVGAVSLGGLPSFRTAYGPLLFDVIRSPCPDDAGGWAHVFDSMCETIRRESDTIAAVVVEPILQGAAGMRMYDVQLLRQLADAARDANVLLIADEVFTGYGRTGPMWACDLAGVAPDLLCTAKAFTGGMLPMAATLASDEVWQGFVGGGDRALMHGHTFSGHPLGAAVAREVLAIYRDEDVLGQVARKSGLIAAAFERLASVPGVLRTRAIGMVGAADLGTGGYEGATGWKVYDEARKRGAWLRPLGDTVYVTPPYTISENELKTLLAILHESALAALAAR
jgi:adenosylmethionine-8-amino-7-oxononanoate aminotransferase